MMGFSRKILENPWGTKGFGVVDIETIGKVVLGDAT